VKLEQLRGSTGSEDDGFRVVTREGWTGRPATAT